uniref:Ig-like domain-containing protein n=1 Tax=Dicentrarchus labrax TaxID=13489 RepID=A0A8P4FZD7_DICLA
MLWVYSLTRAVTNKAVVTLQPNWPKIYKEETITLKCEIKDGEGTDWEYEWQTSSSFKPPKQSESRLIADASHNGDYKCKGRNKSETTSMTEWSGGFKLTVFDKKPQPVLSVSPLWLSPGDSVNLSCEVKEPPSAGWRFYWYKAVPDLSDNSYSYELLPGSSNGAALNSYIVHGQTHTAGYVCRKPKATIRADKVAIPVGGSVTLSCTVNSSSGWKYFWYRGKKNPKPLNTDLRGKITVSQGGDYGSSSLSTNLVTVTNKAVVTLQPNWPKIYKEETITLKCEIKDGEGTDWEYEWQTSSSFKPPKQSESRLIAYASHNGDYKCKGRNKSETTSMTEWSGGVKLTVFDNFHPSASLTVSPDSVQHFTSDSVSLSCKGNSAEWRVRTLKDSLLDDFNCGEMTAATCSVHKLQEGTRVYWCESGSGEFSNTVNITAQKTDIILVSPVRPVTEGDSVSLSCVSRKQTFDSNVFFYLNEKLIQNDTRKELNISAVSKSDEGFYKCQYSGKESPESWVAVKFITGLFVSIVVIILLLLLCYFKMPKGEIM